MANLVSQEVQNLKPLDLDSRSSTCSANLVYGSHKDIYQDITVVKPITTAKSPVYVVNSRATKLNYAMKVFIYQDVHPQIYYQNEIRFAGLRHPNVIKTLYFEKKRQAILDGLRLNISYIITDYASNGDFINFFRKTQEKFDEKLARTYFRQLIEGLEYIHKNNIAHMDLKPDNLLLSDDFTLKIADFDMAHYQEDALIISQGSKGFRAPEVSIGKCIDPKLADIYSAGIVLFTLMTYGVIPHHEKTSVDGINFVDLLYNSPHKFWSLHEERMEELKVSFSAEFRELFVSMTKLNPKSRASLETIKASSWYNGPVLSDEELRLKMGTIFSCQYSQRSLSTVE